ncbi:UDP-N-acetylmuramate dehydrogenase [Bertholletia excelsa]
MIGIKAAKNAFSALPSHPIDSHCSPFRPRSQIKLAHSLSHLTPVSKTQELNRYWSGLKFIQGEKQLSDLSTWGIGGPCRCFVEVFDQIQLVSALRYCQERSLRFMIVGNGSNCLFDDLGLDGCVILNRLGFLEKLEPGMYRVGSGFRFSSLGLICSREGFSGLEFAGGIPGTVGGAAYMNAGANGQIVALSRYGRLGSHCCCHIPTEALSISTEKATGILATKENFTASQREKCWFSFLQSIQFQVFGSRVD